MKTIVIFHASCADGFCAAYLLWSRKFAGDAEYIPMHYGQEPPDVTGAEVYIVDFSFPPEVMTALEAASEKLVLLDHHKTAVEALKNWSQTKESTVVDLDVTLSGAGLVARFLGIESLRLANYVQDRDLWKFQLANSKAVNAYIHSVPLDFSAWTGLELDLEVNIGEVAALGANIESFIAKTAKDAAKKASQSMLLGHLVPVLNCTFAISETLHETLALHPDAPFAAGWFQRSDGAKVFSLRSRGDFDVAALARTVGGGGHPSAAGFQAGMRFYLKSAVRNLLAWMR